MPKVSVIVPNYNHAPYLRMRIDSILNQTYQDFELILLDDCSIDNSQEILLSYKNHPKVSQIVFNETNSGSPFKQWNKGIESATGKYIWIAESDDWAEPQFLEVLLDTIETNPNIVLAYTLARYIGPNGKIQWEMPENGNLEIYKGSDFIRNKLLYANVVHNASMTLFKKETFLLVNHVIYEQMRLCGDWFLYTLLCEHGDVLVCNKIYSNYRVHSTNTSKAAEKEGKSFLEGLDILDYICSKNKKLPLLDYSFFWAKQWVKYKRKYQFSKETNNDIIKKIFLNHKLILFFYKIYNFHLGLKINFCNQSLKL